MSVIILETTIVDGQGHIDSVIGNRSVMSDLNLRRQLPISSSFQAARDNEFHGHRRKAGGNAEKVPRLFLVSCEDASYAISICSKRSGFRPLSVMTRPVCSDLSSMIHHFLCDSVFSITIRINCSSVFNDDFSWSESSSSFTRLNLVFDRNSKTGLLCSLSHVGSMPSICRGTRR